MTYCAVCGLVVVTGACHLCARNRSNPLPVPNFTAASGLNLDVLQAVHLLRSEAWVGGLMTPEFRKAYSELELGGEVGEVLNAAKKLMRAAAGIIGGTTSKENMEEELADVVLCTDELASLLKINLSKAVVNKFNKTSTMRGFNEQLLLPAS